MTRRPWIVGNWKMNLMRGEAITLAREVAAIARDVEGRVDVGIAPPAIWLDPCVGAADGTPLAVYGQNCSTAEKGAFTGDISASMYRDAGAVGTLVGHSERRHVFGETDEQTATKVQRALELGLDVILCVGELLDERRSGATFEVVERQLRVALEGIDLSRITIAYEPVWAIGTGEVATPEQAQEVHSQIRAWVRENYGDSDADSIRIQYGGSAKPGNAAGLLAGPDVDGLLVGGAALTAADFGAIISAAAG